MKTASKPMFRLTLLSLALFGGFAHAAENNVDLQTVEVKGQATSSTHRVTTQKVDESTSTDLKDVLFNEPSVSFGGGNATSQWVTIRGMGQDQIDVKVDDVYTDSQIFHHNGRFLFDPALIKVTAVQKGTGSASAGIGATSGAIVAQTVDAADLLRDGQNVGFKVGAGVSSNKGFSENATVYGRAGGFDALVSANFVHEKEYKDGHGTKVNGSALGQRGLLAKLGYNFNDDHRLVLSHRQERTYGERNLREEFDFSQEGNASKNDARYRILTQDTTNLEYFGQNAGFADKIKANVYYSQSKRQESGQLTDKAGNILLSDPTLKVKAVGGNIGFENRLFERHTLKYGVNYRNQEVNPAHRYITGRGSNVATGSANTTNEKKTDIGAYVEGIWDFEPVTVTTGLRYDYFKAKYSGGKEVSDGSINPSIGLIYDVNPDLSFNASLNYATRSPRLSEAALSGGAVYDVADNLKAEKSRNAEVGFKYRFNNAFSLDGSYFNQKIKDVQAVSDSRYYNGGTLKNQGYEFNTRYTWNGMTARAGVAYNKPKMDGATIDSIVTAIQMGRTWTAGLSYRFDNPNLEIGWRGRFVQHTAYDTTTSTRGATTVTPTKRAGYGVNDIYANWKPTGKDDLNVNFAVNNVGNKYYKPHSQRESGSSNSLPEAGRDFRLAVNYRF